MVKVKDNPTWFKEGNVHVDAWVQHIAKKNTYPSLQKIQYAATLCELAAREYPTETGQSCLHQGLLMGDMLSDLDTDEETIAASILLYAVQYADLSLEDVAEQVDLSVSKLIQGVLRMNALNNMQAFTKFTHNKQQADNVRKMLLAMVDDVRVVLIKLAERLMILRSASILSESIQHTIATEIMEVYAPLANRLGIGAIKWEMEDLAFRYLLPDDYKAIAKGLKSKRLDRDRYVNCIVEELKQLIMSLGISNFLVYGRSKHIHSIYRKMKRKNVPLDAIYDATAVRILVNKESDCYDVLSIVHELYKQVHSEFDDYIAHPKQNGYQSLHTAVIGPEDRIFEVQIRTYQMHDLAEMGVAAHWKYKEGGITKQQSHERKIEWLRSVLSWHKEMATNKGVSLSVEMEFLEDRVYVFTPEGDVLDLPHGVTPLDFAYHVHTELGHRCRGAKVNGNIVPLTYTLKTGDRIEILTTKEARPSRDWINPHLHYLQTSRAKAKVLHWFKMQDFEKNRMDGQILLDKELKHLGIKIDKLNEVVQHLNYKKTDDLLAAIGRHDLKLSQVIARISPSVDELSVDTPVFKSISKAKVVDASNLKIEGVGNLLTHMARCCQPVPGDPVIGYVTLGRGVSIHRQECVNILHSDERQKTRFVEVSWGSQDRAHYYVDVIVKAYDRNGLLKDITSLLSHEKAHVQSLQSKKDKEDNQVSIEMTLEIDGISGLSRLLHKLSQLPNVFEARRQG
jgi:GTP pyrophosphokinase